MGLVYIRKSVTVNPCAGQRGPYAYCCEANQSPSGVPLDMFTHRTAQLRLARVHALVNVFLACVSLPLAVSNDHSVTIADYQGPARRAPNLTFKVIERGTQGGLPSGEHAVPYRRSYHPAKNGDGNYVPRRVPVSPHRRTHYRRANVDKNYNRNENKNVIVKVNNGANVVYKDETSFPEIVNSVPKPENDSIVTRLEMKLYSCVIFRFNIITVFGQILKAPNNRLTIDQFTSLNLILQALIHKQVYIFNLLPVLKKLQGADKTTQFKVVVQALSSNVPVYLASACQFWLNEIEKGTVNIEELNSLIEQPANFLTEMDPAVIDTCEDKVAAEELEPFDEASKVTKKTLGPVFVNIFYKVKKQQIKLTQKLFGAILINLPIGKLNPVLEEYINYIWDVMQNNSLPNWYNVALEIKYGNPYNLVNSVAKILLSKKDTPTDLKFALKYILLHLKKVPSTYSDEYYPDMQMLSNNDKNVELMFSMIQDDVTIPELGNLKDLMVGYIKHMNIDQIIKGMNKYIYQKPIHVLIALLVKIQGRTQEKDIRNVVLKLLSILVSKNELDSFAVTVSNNVDMVMLLDFLNVASSDPAILTLGQNIQHYLEGDLDLLSNLQGLIPKKDKSKCHRPVQCLLNVFSKILNPNNAKQFKVPPNLFAMVQQLFTMVKSVITTAKKCEPHDLMSFESLEFIDEPSNVVVQTIPEVPESVSPSKPTVKPTYQTVTPLISTDFKENVAESGEVAIVAPPHVKEKEKEVPVYPTLPISPEGTIQEVLSTLIPTLIFNPGSKLPPTLTELKPTSMPQTTQAFQPPVISSVKPTVQPSIAPPKEPSVLSTPGGRPTKKRPAKHKPNDLLHQTENKPVLPPNFSFDLPMFVVFPKGDTPPYALPTKPSDLQDSETVCSFPSIKELLQGFNPNIPFQLDELPDMPEILEPLEQALGLNFIQDILGEHVDKTKYPTVISLMVDLLDHALVHPQVTVNPKLVLSIQQYLKGIDYICITALFPVVIDSQQIPSDVLHVTFDPDNPNANSVDSESPPRIPEKFMTLLIYHPKYWVQQVDLFNPYGTLLPSLDGGEDNPIQKLLSDGSLQEILGIDFDPLLYPNKGTLLMTIFQKLITSQHVILDSLLMKQLNAYLKCIRTVALYSKIPENYEIHFHTFEQNNAVNWQPNTVSLIVALPPAQNQQEAEQINLIKSFLETPNLLQILQIPNPSYSSTRGALLKIIFEVAIRGNKIVLDPLILAALKYYESKILLHGHGALPIIWVWVQVFIIHEEVPLGEIIESVIDYNSLSNELKMSYNELMTYFSENMELLQAIDDFPFQNYLTKGTFLKGLFTYFLNKFEISSESKKYLEQLISHIQLTGHGAEQMNHVTVNNVTDEKIYEYDYSFLFDDW